MRNATRSRALPETPCPGNCCSRAGRPQSHPKGKASARPCEVLATIRLPKNRRINIDRTLDSSLDALAVEGSVEHIDTVFIRVYRGARKRAVEVSVTHAGTTQEVEKGYTRARGDR